MNDIFQEVEEDLRRERLEKLWARYGNYVIGAAVLIVAGTAAFMWWRDHDKRQAEIASEQLVTATELVQRGEAAQAQQVLADAMASRRGGVTALARFNDAQVKLRTGDTSAAIATYRALSEDSSVDRDLRQVAGLFAVLHDLDRADVADLERRLQPLLAADSRVRHAAGEMAAVVALRRGDLPAARQWLNRVVDDPAAPLGMRARAAEMLAALGP